MNKNPQIPSLWLLQGKNVLLALENLQNGILDTEEKRKEAFTKEPNSLKASITAKELRKFYHS